MDLGFPTPQATPRDGSLIAVWFSCGAASAVAAKKTLEIYGSRCVVRVINSPVIEEDEDNRRFLKDTEKWLGVPVETAINSDWPNCSAREVWEQRSFMAGPKGAPCTEQLKKEARYQWERANRPDWHVLGFTADEEKRAKNFILGERGNTLPVLIDAKITKAMCFDIVRAAGIALPQAYLRGYPNANCKGCVKASSPTYWNHVRRVDPEVFKDRAEQSRRMGKDGCRLVEYKGERIFLDELPPDAVGAPMKTLGSECGVFCEERTAA
jgi:hypothetical protein